MASVNEKSASNPADIPDRNANENKEFELYSRARMNALKIAGIAFLAAASAVILMALYSLNRTANLPAGTKKNAAPAMIAVLGVFVSLGGSACFMNAGQMKKRIESVESLLRQGKTDDEIAVELGLRPDTVQLVRSAMKG